MTERQKRFIDHYIQTANASEAARLAGYSERTARIHAAKLLAKTNIRESIDGRLKELESERIAETKELLEHLTSVIRGQVTEEVVTNSGKKFVVEVSEKDKLKAVEMLLKVHGAFKDKVDVKVSGGELFIQTLEKVLDEDR